MMHSTYVAQAYAAELGKQEGPLILNDSWWHHFKEKQDRKVVMRR